MKNEKFKNVLAVLLLLCSTLSLRSQIDLQNIVSPLDDELVAEIDGNSDCHGTRTNTNWCFNQWGREEDGECSNGGFSTHCISQSGIGYGLEDAIDTAAWDVTLTSPLVMLTHSVYAVYQGKIVRVNSCFGEILIQHILPNGDVWYSSYMHMANLAFTSSNVGEWIEQGIMLGTVSNQSASSACCSTCGHVHLHFAIYTESDIVNLPGNTTDHVLASFDANIIEYGLVPHFGSPINCGLSSNPNQVRVYFEIPERYKEGNGPVTISEVTDLKVYQEIGTNVHETSSATVHKTNEGLFYFDIILYANQGLSYTPDTYYDIEFTIPQATSTGLVNDLTAYGAHQVYFARDINQFADIDISQPVSYQIENVLSQGLLKGSADQFDLEQKISYGEACKAIVELGIRLERFHYLLDGNTHPNVPRGHPYFPYIQTLKQLNVLNSTAFDDNKSADDEISYEVFCELVYTALLDGESIFSVYDLGPTQFQGYPVEIDVDDPIRAYYVKQVEGMITKLSQATNGQTHTFIERFTSGVKSSLIGGSVVYTIDGEQKLKKKALAFIISNIFDALYESPAPPMAMMMLTTPAQSSADLSEVSVLGSKIDQASTDNTTQTPDVTTLEAHLELASGQSIDLGSGQEEDSYGNRLSYYWTSTDGVLTTCNERFSEVCYIAPDVTVASVEQLYVWIGNNKGKAAQAFINVIIHPEGSTSPSQVTNLRASNIDTDQAYLIWDRGDGDGCIVTATPCDIAEVHPVNGSSYNYENSYNLSQPIANSETKVVYLGTNNNVLVNELEAGECYTFRAYEFVGGGTSRAYNTILPASKTVNTYDPNAITLDVVLDPQIPVEGQPVDLDAIVHPSGTYPVLSADWVFSTNTIPSYSSGSMHVNDVMFTEAGEETMLVSVSLQVGGQVVNLYKQHEFQVIDQSAAYPDAIFDDAWISPEISIAEGEVCMDWTIKNVGFADMMLNNVEYFLSIDAELDSMDFQFPVEPDDYHNVMMDMQDMYQNKRELVLPDSLALGQYWIIARFHSMDGLDDMFEQNLVNNEISLPLFIEEELPDYVIENVQLSTSTISSGDQFQVDFDILNQGYQVITPGCSNYHFYISQDTVLDVGDTDWWEGYFVYGQGCTNLGGHTIKHINRQINTLGWLSSGSYYFIIAFDHDFDDFDGDIIEISDINNYTWIPLTVSNPNQPTIQASNLYVKPIDEQSVKLSWSRGDGNACVVYATSEDGSLRRPVDGITYQPNTSWISAGPIWDDDDQQWRNNTRVLYSGIDSTVVITDLPPDRTWYFTVYEYDQGSLDYLPANQEVVLTHLSTTPDPSSWYTHFAAGNANPFGANFNAFEYSDNSIGYGASRNGYFLRTFDRGISFDIRKICDHALNKLACQDQYVLTSGFYDNVYLSIDNGNTWSHIDLKGIYGIERIYDLSITEDYTLFVACRRDVDEGVILRSSDYGQTWEKVFESNEKVYDLQTAGNRVMVSGQNGLLKELNNNGVSWSDLAIINPDSMDWYDMVISNNYHIVLGSPTSTISSLDGTMTWQVLEDSSTYNFDYVTMSVISDSVIYRLSDYKYLLKSTDNGESWQNTYLPSISNNNLYNWSLYSTQSRVWIGGENLMSHPHMTNAKWQYPDIDLDGFGATYDSLYFDGTFPGWTSISGDCDDTNSNINPAANEVCDGIDNQCNEQVDEGVSLLLFRDVDGDGFGVWYDTIRSCSVLTGYTFLSGDCDDTDNSVYPGAYELCDSLDNNCNGIVDEMILVPFYKDSDGDGWGCLDSIELHPMCESVEGFAQRLGDCDDTNEASNPSMVEICNGIDDDCIGGIDNGIMIRQFRDNDGDSFGNQDSLIVDCELHLGYVLDSLDCNDFDSSINPFATEQCDYLDNDCNGQVDENYLCNDGNLSINQSWIPVHGEIEFSYSSSINGSLPVLEVNDTAIVLPNYSGTQTVVFDKPGLKRCMLVQDDVRLGEIPVIVANGFVTPYVEGIEEDSVYNYCETWDQGKLHIDPDNIPFTNPYTVTYYLFFPTSIDGDDCKLSMRVNNATNIGGQNDLTITSTMLGTLGESFLSLSDEYDYRFMGANDQILIISPYMDYRNWQEWKEVGFETRGNNTMKFYGDLYVTNSSTYPGEIGDLIGISISFQGSGSIEWIEIYDGSNLLWSSNFSECSSNLEYSNNSQSFETSIVKQEIVGVLELETFSDIQIYPNPSSQNIEISGNCEFEQIQFFDLLGNSIYYSNLEKTRERIDISKFQPGIYFVSIYDDCNKHHVKKFIKE